METRPLVSILINNYNYGRFLGDAIDSALAQDYPHCEVIVVDDASTDHSRDVLARFGSAVRSLVHPTNRGQATCINTAFEASGGSIVCLLDSDDTFLPQKVSLVVEAFVKEPVVQWVWHYLRPVEKDLRPMARQTEPAVAGLKDFRRTMLGYRVPFRTATFSGTSYRRDLFSRLLPFPDERGAPIADHYLKYGAMALEKGWLLPEEPGLRRFHGENYTLGFREFGWNMAVVGLYTAVAMRERFPRQRRFHNKNVATALGVAARLGIGPDDSALPVVEEYCRSVPWWERLEIKLLSLYFRFRPLPQNPTLGRPIEGRNPG